MIRKARRRTVDQIVLPGAVTGSARVDRKTKNLITRLVPGEIAVIDHEDIDRVSAEGLIQHQPAAVINAASSSTGRYPNLGPLLLCSSGVLVLDEVGPEIMEIDEGSRLMIDGGRVFRLNGKSMIEIGRGRVLDLAAVEKALDSAKQSIALEIERFAENTIEYIRDERDLLLEAARLPEVRTDFHGRHVLIVVRGHGYKEDLATLRPYIREVRPVLVAVDGGADALIDSGLKPDMIVGDMDSVTTEALLSGAEVVVHAYPGGRAPGLERIDALGIPHVLFESSGTSEDIAMLLSHEQGAELIVAVGTHANLIEFMDKGRKGMASTFLTRLRVGPILVDAKGVSRLYRMRVRRRDLGLLLLAAVFSMAVVVSVSDPVRADLSLWWTRLENLFFSIRQALF
jgi:uncharacterized membrane-anchored protein